MEFLVVYFFFVRKKVIVISGLVYVLHLYIISG
jgi:hypothetical protein